MPKEDTQFKGEGKGISYGQRPICVMFPEPYDSILRSMKNRSDYVRSAVIAALSKDGLGEVE